MQNVSSVKGRLHLMETLISACCSPLVFSKVLAARMANLFPACKCSQRPLCSSRKWIFSGTAHSIPLIRVQTDQISMILCKLSSSTFSCQTVNLLTNEQCLDNDNFYETIPICLCRQGKWVNFYATKNCS